MLPIFLCFTVLPNTWGDVLLTAQLPRASAYAPDWTLATAQLQPPPPRLLHVQVGRAAMLDTPPFLP
jgi:hypothetical protein